MATMKSITASGSRLGQLKRLALVLAKNICLLYTSPSPRDRG